MTGEAPLDSSILNVGTSASPAQLASELAARLGERPVAHLEALAPAAIANAVEAVILCRPLVEGPGWELKFVPSFVEWTVGDEPRIAVRITVRVQFGVTSSAETS